MDRTGLARLTDFGFSRVISDLEPAAPVTEGRAVRWASPEVLNMEPPVTKASDIYSFAMVIVEVCVSTLISAKISAHKHKTFTGRVPFYDNTLTMVIVDVLSGRRPTRPTDPRLTDDLWKLTERCWSHDPRQRPRIAEVVLRLQTASASRRDRPSLDGTTLGTFRQQGSLLGKTFYSPLDEIMLKRIRGYLSPTLSRTPVFCGVRQGSHTRNFPR